MRAGSNRPAGCRWLPTGCSMVIEAFRRYIRRYILDLEVLGTWCGVTGGAAGPDTEAGAGHGMVHLHKPCEGPRQAAAQLCPGARAAAAAAASSGERPPAGAGCGAGGPDAGTGGPHGAVGGGPAAPAPRHRSTRFAVTCASFTRNLPAWSLLAGSVQFVICWSH